MDTPAIIGTALLALGTGALVVLRLNRDERDEFSAYGDVPAIHGEMRVAARSAGGRASSNDDPMTNEALTHRGEG